jgi:hypothetical protein
MSQGSSNTMKWVLGCGLGCLVLVIVCVVLVAGGGYFAFTKGTAALGELMAQGLKTKYDALKAEGAIPAERVAAYDEMVQIGQAKTTSPWATIMIAGAILGPLDDKQVSAEEAAQVQTVFDFVKSNPDCSVMEYGQFVEQHPELQGIMQKAQMEMQGMQPPAGMPPVPMNETPVEQSEPAPAAPPAN